MGQSRPCRAKALVVEDDPMQREMIGLLLEESDFDVIFCASAEAAELVLRGDGDTVVLMMTDVELAGNMTGVELAHVAKRYRPDLDVIVTHAARLLPVRQHGEPAMLKLSHEPNERLGGIVMAWWDGDGAARVLARDGKALLLERAMGAASLSDIARTGRDDEACRILCATADRKSVV